MKGKIIGIVLLIVICCVFYIFLSTNKSKIEVIELKGYLGGEKKGFMNDLEIQKILKEKYGIIFEYSKAGSIEMVKEDYGDSDYLFPSSQVALEIFKMNQQEKLVKSDIVFNSPIVFYSWDKVTDAFIKNGLVEKKNSSFYTIDTKKLIQVIRQQKDWSDFGLSELYGSVLIESTDPTKSNSGNMFSGLLANILSGEGVIKKNSVPEVLPDIKEFYQRLGYLEHSSGDLFEGYLKQGMGAKPLIVGYESQIIEFAVENPELWERVKDKVRILYPIPTVWSSHPYIALNSNALKAIAALRDEDIQKLAWSKHGFRTGMIGVTNDIEILDVVGIPETINSIISMPTPEIMDMIITGLSEER